MCAAQTIPRITIVLYNYCIYMHILYHSYKNKIRYRRCATTHTHGENKSLKSCTVLIEGKDTHDNCFKKDREEKRKWRKYIAFYKTWKHSQFQSESAYSANKRDRFKLRFPLKKNERYRWVFGWFSFVNSIIALYCIGPLSNRHPGGFQWRKNNTDRKNRKCTRHRYKPQ